MVDNNIIISDTLRPNSYEIGKAANRHKIYYNTPEDLKKHLEALHAMGVLQDQEE